MKLFVDCFSCGYIISYFSVPLIFFGYFFLDKNLQEFRKWLITKYLQWLELCSLLLPLNIYKNNFQKIFLCFKYTGESAIIVSKTSKLMNQFVLMEGACFSSSISLVKFSSCYFCKSDLIHFHKKSYHNKMCMLIEWNLHNFLLINYYRHSW